MTWNFRTSDIRMVERDTKLVNMDSDRDRYSGLWKNLDPRGSINLKIVFTNWDRKDGLILLIQKIWINLVNPRNMD